MWLWMAVANSGSAHEPVSDAERVLPSAPLQICVDADLSRDVGTCTCFHMYISVEGLECSTVCVVQFRKHSLNST